MGIEASLSFALRSPGACQLILDGLADDTASIALAQEPGVNARAYVDFTF